MVSHPTKAQSAKSHPAEAHLARAHLARAHPARAHPAKAPPAKAYSPRPTWQRLPFKAPHRPASKVMPEKTRYHERNVIVKNPVVSYSFSPSIQVLSKISSPITKYLVSVETTGSKRPQKFQF